MRSRPGNPRFACPGEADWMAWLQLEPPAADSGFLEEHLSACLSCQTLLEQLTADETLLSWRRLLNLSRDATIKLNGAELLDGPAPGNAAVADEPEQIEGYTTLRLLGQGATGRVVLAQDPQLQRPVALKILRSELLLDSVWKARFVREARIIAGLRHEHIVHVHRLCLDGGKPFLVLEHIDGSSLEQLVKQGPLPLAQIAEWMRQIAEALAFAHAQGVLHRDVKPGNILIESKTNRALLADFGLAGRLAGNSGPQATALTQTGVLMGTPAYISPEQVAAAPLDGRADVYGLGATAYACLTGVPPFQGTLAAVLQQVVDVEPRQPRRLNPEVPADLETICLKCLAKEPRLRYADAATLADDLRRFEAGEPIRARPLSSWQRGRRWLRRNRLAGGLIGGLAASTLLAAFLAWLAWTSAHDAFEQSRKAEGHRQAADRNEQKAVLERNERTRLVQRQYLQTVDRDIRLQRFRQARETLDTIPDELRGWEYHWLSAQARRRNDLARIVGIHEDGPIVALLAAPDCGSFVTSGLDGRVLVWSGNGEPPRELEKGIWSEPFRAWRRFGVPLLLEPAAEPLPDCFAALAWVIPGEELVGVSCRGRIKRWRLDVTAGLELVADPHSQPLSAVAIAPDRTFLLCGDEQGALLKQPLGATPSTAALIPVRQSSGAAVTQIVGLSGGHWLLGFADGRLEVYDQALASPKQSLRTSAPVWDLAVAPSGETIAVASGTANVGLYSFTQAIGQLKPSQTLQREDRDSEKGAVQAIRYSNDGKRLLTADERGVVTLWTLPNATVEAVFTLNWRPNINPQRLRVLPWRLRRHIAGVVAADDSTRILAAGLDGVLREWRRERVPTERLLNVGPRPQVRPDSERAGALWVGTADGKLALLDIAAGTAQAETQAHQGAVISVDVARVAKLAVTGGADRIIRLWRDDGKRLECVETLSPHAHPLKHVAISSDGSKLAWTDHQDTVFLWDRMTRRLVASHSLRDEVGKHQGSGRLSFSGDGRTVAVAGAFQRFWILSAEDGRVLERLDALVGVGTGVVDFALNPKNPQELVAIDSLGGPRVYPNPFHFPPEERSGSPLVASAYSSDGERLILADERGAVFFVDRRGCGLLPFKLGPSVPPARPTAIGFDASGQTLWLVHQNGDLLLRSARPTPSTPAAPELRDWTALRLLHGPAARSMPLRDSTVALNAEDRLQCVWPFRSEATVPARGEASRGVVFGRQVGNDMLLEHIREFVGGDQVRQALPTIEHRGLALLVTAKSTFLAVQTPLRQSATATRPELWLLRRDPSAKQGDWLGTALLPPPEPTPLSQILQNAGYDPILSHTGDGGFSVLHFSHAGHYLLKNSIDAAGNRLPTRLLGRQDDGLSFRAALDARNRWHIALPAPWPTYLEADQATGATRARSRVSDDVTAHVLSLALTPLGTPRLVYWTTTPDHRRQLLMATRLSSHWRHEAVGPSLAPEWIASNVVCADEENAQVAFMEQPRRRILLATRLRNGEWRLEKVRSPSCEEWPLQGPEETCNIMLRLDSRQQPVIVLSSSSDQKGSLWIVRPSVGLREGER